MKKLFSLPSILLAASTLFLILLKDKNATVMAQDCEMSIWVFDTLDRCNTINPPNAVGTIYADGQCHATATSTDTDYDLFPGNYRAFCTTDGLIRFHESGCIEDTCSSTSFAEDAVCNRDTSKIAALYSRLDPPQYVVQAREDASTGGLYTCLRLLGTGINVTFVVFGDCSDSGCAVYGESTPVAAPTPIAKPAPAPTEPPEADPTDPPVTDSPTDKPAPEPTRAPATTPTTDAPTPVPTTAAPTDEPTLTPTFRPIAEGDPTRQPVVTEAPTEPEPTPAPVEKKPTLPTSSVGMVTSRIRAALHLSPMSGLLPDGENGETGLSLWDKNTILQIETSAIQKQDITVSETRLSNVKQTIVPDSARARHHRQRRLVEEQTLEIAFDLDMTYYGSKEPIPTLQEIFDLAFAKEADRTNYVLKFASADDPEFDSLRVVSVVAPEEQTATAENSNMLGIIAGVVGGVVFAFVLAGFLFFRHRRKTKQVESKEFPVVESSMGNGINAYKTKEETPGSGTANMFASAAQPPQVRWTNEIVVDPSADDVSTLGGSVLNGLNLQEGGNNGTDEPTASVNLDYDYDRQQYRTDIDDIRSRSVASGTAFTQLSKLGMPGESVFADDMSFEQQYADEDEAMLDGAVDASRRPKPFEVRAPPGLLGMVIDTPNGGVPVVRAIKPDSILTGRVLIGDRLISVDHQDVTSMSALEVSNLISVRSNRQRLLVFVRLANNKV